MFVFPRVDESCSSQHGVQNPHLQDSKPELLSLHRLATNAFSFQLGVEFFKVLAPEIHQSLARVVVIGFVRAEEGPILILLDDSTATDPQKMRELSSFFFEMLWGVLMLGFFKTMELSSHVILLAKILKSTRN